MAGVVPFIEIRESKAVASFGKKIMSSIMDRSLKSKKR